MLKVIFALGFTLVFMLMLSTVMIVPWPVAYVVAAIVSVFWAAMSHKADRVSWFVIIAFAVIGATLYWGLEQAWALYLLVLSVSVLFATLAVMITSRPRNPLSSVRASKGPWH